MRLTMAGWLQTSPRIKPRAARGVAKTRDAFDGHSKVDVLADAHGTDHDPENLRFSIHEHAAAGSRRQRSGELQDLVATARAGHIIGHSRGAQNAGRCGPRQANRVRHHKHGCAGRCVAGTAGFQLQCAPDTASQTLHSYIRWLTGCGCRTRDFMVRIFLVCGNVACAKKCDQRGITEMGYRFAPNASRRPSQSFTTNSRQRHGMLPSPRTNSTPRDEYSV